MDRNKSSLEPCCVPSGTHAPGALLLANATKQFKFWPTGLSGLGSARQFVRR